MNRERIRLHLLVRLRPIAFIAVLLILWQIAADRNSTHLLPGPIETAGGIADLVRHGLLLKYVTASLFRVTWGFVGAAVLAIPLGLLIGWYRRAEMAFNPLLQIFRPISGQKPLCQCMLRRWGFSWRRMTLVRKDPAFCATWGSQMSSNSL